MEQSAETTTGSEFGESAMELQLALSKRPAQEGQKLAAKDPAQHFYREQEVIARVDPALAIRTQAASGDHAVNVRMVRQVLAPGVEHGQETDVRAEVPGVGGDLQQSFRYGAEQNAIQDPPVLESQGCQQMRQREDHMEIGNRKQFRRAVGEPLLARRALALGAMPVAAGVVGVDPMSAPVAGAPIPAENGCPAVFDRVEDAPMIGVQQLAILRDKLFPVGTDDIGHLAGRPVHHGSV